MTRLHEPKGISIICIVTAMKYFLGRTDILICPVFRPTQQRPELQQSLDMDNISEEKRIDCYDHMHPLINENCEEISTDATTTDQDPFQIIQQFDEKFQPLMAEKEYNRAFNIAVEMWRCAPKSYYGYLRMAQIRLAESAYGKLFQICCQGFKSIESNNGVDLLRRWIKDIVYVLNHEVATLYRACEFDNAHRMTNWIMHLLPASPSGYVLAGELYEAQDMNSKAMEAYNRGITSVISIRERSTLVECKRKLQQKIDRQYDFIQLMPHEIGASIIRLLGTPQIIECMRVSSGWREFIPQCPEAWRRITSCEKLSNNITLLQQVKTFVRRIKIHHITPSILENIITPVMNCEFVNLMDIELSDGVTFQRTAYKHLLKSLNISTFRLVYSDDNVEVFNQRYIFSLDEFLEDYPYLTHLDLRTYGAFIRVNYHRLPKTMITHLIIGAFNGQNHFSIEWTVEYPPFLSAFPNLTYLCVPSSSCTSEDLQAMIELCPNLHWLKIGIIANDRDESFTEHSNQGAKIKGLHYLEICDTDMDPEILGSVINKNSSTLETLKLQDAWLNPIDWEKISIINCPVLKTFKIWLGPSDSSPSKPIVGSCPLLENISLSGFKNLDVSILPSLLQLQQLQRLELIDCESLTRTEPSLFFCTLFNHEHGTNLQTLYIRGGDTLNDMKTLKSLTRLKNLRSLHVSHCDLVTSDMLKEYAAVLKETVSRLKEIAFDFLVGVTDEVILCLIQALPHLQRLKLEDLVSITDRMIWGVARASSVSKLPNISITRCPFLSFEAIDYAHNVNGICINYDY